MYSESDIMYESANVRGAYYWVLRQPKAYTVMQGCTTHSETIQAFERSADGLSIAIRYAQYKASRLQ
jgi:hypothetical protein